MREASEPRKSFQNAQQTPVASREKFLLAIESLIGLFMSLDMSNEDTLADM